MVTNSEQLIESTGGFGRYQLRLCLIGALSIYFCSCSFMVMTFSTAEPAWKCIENSTSCTLEGSFKPGDKHYKHRCSLSRDAWTFDVQGDFDSIVTEWDLVCDTAVYVSIANSMVFVSWMLGASLGSIVSDKIGRKKVLFPFTIYTCLCGFISSFAQAYWVFALSRTLMGIGLGAYSACAFTLVMEYVGPKYRSRVGFGVFYGWSLALFTIALLGYLVGQWRILSRILSVPGLLYFIFWWFFPESLRWLIVKGRVEEAKTILREIAKSNKKEIKEEDLAFLDTEVNEKEAQRLGDVRDLFANRKLAIRTLVSWFVWAVASMVYYGIFLGAPSLGGNMYLNFFITALCEAIAMAIGMYLLDKIGRKKSVMFSIWLGAISMIVGAIITYYDDGSSGYLAGKIMSTLVFGIVAMTIVFDGIYVYSSELFPTTVRNTALGTSSAAARIGSGSAPYIVYSSRVHALMPCGIMAAFAVACGLLLFLLPETHKKPMPDTVNQVEALENMGFVKDNDIILTKKNDLPAEEAKKT